jgi:hypothetical protein
MVPLTSDGNEGKGAEQNFSKVNGSRLGSSSGDGLTNCRRAIGHSLPCGALDTAANGDEKLRKKDIRGTKKSSFRNVVFSSV